MPGPIKTIPNDLLFSQCAARVEQDSAVLHKFSVPHLSTMRTDVSPSVSRHLLVSGLILTKATGCATCIRTGAMDI